MKTDSAILVVDDDPKIRTLLRNVLESEGFAVREAGDAATALDALHANGVDLVTLDLQLGGDDGFDVARSVRKFSQVPIIMVTGKDDVIDRVVGLEIGADDYITKPFHVREVLARVRSVLRRTKQNAVDAANLTSQDDCPDSPAYRFDGLIAVPDQMELKDRAGQFLELTSGDFKLLNVFIQKAKRVLSRDQLMTLTGGVEWSPLDRTIDNQVARLRKKIERDPADPRLIKTVRGVGYTFACDVEVLQSASSVKSA